MAESGDLEVARDWEKIRERRCTVSGGLRCPTGCGFKMLRNGKLERTGI